MRILWGLCGKSEGIMILRARGGYRFFSGDCGYQDYGSLDWKSSRFLWSKGG